MEEEEQNVKMKTQHPHTDNIFVDLLYKVTQLQQN